MPVIIGARNESSFVDPLGMLSDCHRRIERFLRTLLTLADEFQGAALDTEQRTALETSLRYFREAAPKHTADEEESLFPRLRRIGSPEARALLARIDALEHDHQQAARNHQEVERLGQLWLATGWLAPEDAARLAVLLAGLSELYGQHIAFEDREIFPAAERLISLADREAIGVEMAQRRGLADTVKK